MSNNFTSKAETALNRAVTLAENFGHTYVGSEHILLSLAEDETSCSAIILRKQKITYEKVEQAIKEYSGVGVKSKLTSKDTTPKCRKILENSYKCSKKFSAGKIGTEHILYALIEEKEAVSSRILIKIEADIIGLKDELVSFLRSSEKSLLFAEQVPDSSIPNLLKYGRVITKLAEQGELDPVIGREKETDRVIRILSRKSKNNPCLIGEAGVGKTAIVEGLATKISEGRVPASLIGKIIISLDLTSMVAGAKYRGDFEERIKSIMNEASRNKSIILFIDEIHTIVGAGAAEGAIDAANIMKPELSRGNIQLIGATTMSEYRKYIEKDSALERRFQPVMVEEPTAEGALEILFGLRERYEKHHNIKISNSAITSAVKLSERYIQDRYLPDKAIDILDEACAMASVSNELVTEKTQKIKDRLRQIALDKKNAINERDYEMAMNLKDLERLYSEELSEELIGAADKRAEICVSSKEVEKVILEITGVNPSQNFTDEISDIYSKLSASVIGQDPAVKMLCDAVKRSFAGINEPNRPRGIFLFLGESGVGKTELAKALTYQLFGSYDSLIRCDMSEFSESNAVSKLVGAAPGYVGYDETISFIERIRRHPYSVVLFDEIEKAHSDVLSLFLQIFDSGILTDSLGRKINFRNTYIIMTSNIGAESFRESKNVGFLNSDKLDSMQEKLRGYFKDEFINRIDEIILFSSLDSSALKEISKLKISDIIKRLRMLDIEVVCEDEVYGLLAEKGKAKGFGARPLNRMITAGIENKIASMLVDGSISHGETVKLSVRDNEILCEKILMSKV